MPPSPGRRGGPGSLGPPGALPLLLLLGLLFPGFFPPGSFPFGAGEARAERLEVTPSDSGASDASELPATEETASEELSFSRRTRALLLSSPLLGAALVLGPVAMVTAAVLLARRERKKAVLAAANHTNVLSPDFVPLSDGPKTPMSPYALLFPGTGRRQGLRAGRSSLGAGPGNDVVVDMDSVSSIHAELSVDSEGCALRDLGSLNGTYLNGVKAEGTVRLREGDRILFGGAGALLVREDHGGEAATSGPPPRAPV